MKKSTIVTTGFIIVIVLLGVSFLWANQSDWTIMTKTLTQQQAIKEMPYITITDEDFLLMQTISQDDDIKKALNNGQITDSIIQKGNKLAGEMLPEDIQSSTVHSNDVFSVGTDSIYIDYVSNNHRVILASYENSTIMKTVSRYSKNGKVKTTYENRDNKEYRKSSLVPLFWFNIFGN